MKFQMKNIKILLIAALFLGSFLNSPAEQKLLLDIARGELNRTMQELKKEEKPPYFMSYTITDKESIRIKASFGKLEADSEDKGRILDIDLRVGDYNFDNTHIIRGASFSFGSLTGSTDLPFTNDEKAIRTAIWYATDKKYKSAVEAYDKALTNKAVKVQEEDTSADFSHEKPNKFFGKDFNITIDKDAWKNRLRNLSAAFNDYDWMYNGDITFSLEILHKYFINSEGSELFWTEATSRIMVIGKTKAEDGMSLPLYKSYFAFDPKDLPSDETIARDIQAMIKLLGELRKAPMAEPFSGPAILSGEASGVFFHEIFGHRVEGHREKDPNSSQTFKDQIGKKILPDFIDVVFDPTIKTLDGREVSGFYQYDDEGVPAQKVVTVDHGIFKRFLMSRSPIKGFPNSNGHGRKQAGYDAVSRQSNLVVVAHQSVPFNDLKEQLRKECKKQKKEYGLYYVTVEGGFTFTSRTIPNAFNVNPIVVYKIYADGRPDELVRGVDLIGTPLTTFSNIIGASKDIGIFNGICGAESGGVPVSASSPSLLVSLIEVQKKQKSQAKPPILTAP